MPPLRDWSVLDRDVLNTFGEDIFDRQLLPAAQAVRLIIAPVAAALATRKDRQRLSAATALVTEECDAKRARYAMEQALGFTRSKLSGSKTGAGRSNGLPRGPRSLGMH